MSGKRTKIIARDRLIKAKGIILKLREMQQEKTRDDEKALLEKFTDSIRAYENLVKAALDDNKVTKEEMIEIQIIEKKILQDAQAQMYADGVVTDEEKKLMVELLELFEEMTESD